MLGMGSMFDATITGDDVSEPKPDPEGIFKAMRALQAVPEETLFVGDSNADIQAGKSAGL